MRRPFTIKPGRSIFPLLTALSYAWVAHQGHEYPKSLNHSSAEPGAGCSQGSVVPQYIYAFTQTSPHVKCSASPNNRHPPPTPFFRELYMRYKQPRPHYHDVRKGYNTARETARGEAAFVIPELLVLSNRNFPGKCYSRTFCLGWWPSGRLWHRQHLQASPQRSTKR